jgi:hypothetical protein
MNTLTFLNAPLLWGLVLAAIPIIIHLLYRRRFRRVEWAPMKYLKLSLQKNRRRIQLEQLLLLLLRTALILLLIFLVARPLVHAAGLAGWLGGRSRANHLLLIDDSLSMGYREAGRSAFDRAQELAREIISSIGPKDRFTLMLASRPKTPLLHEVELVDARQALALVAAAQETDVHVAWANVLAEVERRLAGATYPIGEVSIITDLRRAGWGDALQELSDRLQRRRVRMRVYNVGSTQTDNLAVLSLEQADPLALVGVPVRWEAVVHNATPGELSGLEADFAVDGQATLVQLPPIAAGALVRVPLVARFPTAGTHHLSFSLRLPGSQAAHDLPGDNSIAAVVHVAESLSVALVDGEPASEPLGGELDFFALALTADETNPIVGELVSDAELDDALALRPDLMVLANVAALSPQQADRLTRLVQEGMGLMVFLGEQVDAELYNELLHARGRGLLPASLEAVAETETAGLTLDAADAGPLAGLAQLHPAQLERIRIRKYYEVRLPDRPPSGTRVLARWNNDEGSPACIYRPFGRGRVLLWTLTADRSWSDWPTEPSYVLCMLETARAMARSEAGTRILTAGTPLRHALPTGVTATSPAVELPGGEAPVAMQIEMAGRRQASGSAPSETSTAADGSAGPDGAAAAGTPAAADAAAAAVPSAGWDGSPAVATLVYDDTRRAGIYRLTWQATPGGAAADLYAVQPDRRESDLRPIAEEELKALFGGAERVEVITPQPGAPLMLAVQGKEIWRSLAACLLGLLLVESGLATWAGRQR